MHGSLLLLALLVLVSPVAAAAVETESTYVRQTTDGLSVFRLKAPESPTWGADWWIPSNATSVAVGLEDMNLQVHRRPIGESGTRIQTQNGMDLWRINATLTGNSTVRLMSVAYNLNGTEYLHRTSLAEQLVVYMALLPGVLPQTPDGLEFIVHKPHPTQPVFATLPTPIEGNQTVSVEIFEPPVSGSQFGGGLSFGLLAGVAGGLAAVRFRGKPAAGPPAA